MKLSEVGEDEIVQRLLSKLESPPQSLIGPGDDCAVTAEGTLLKTDCIVENVHFLPETNARLVGRKAVARVISDFAAMGGYPEHFLVTVAVTQSTPLKWLEELYTGIGALCSEYQSYVVGGETTSLPDGSANWVSVSGTGKLFNTKPLLRSSAQLGDHIYVSGTLGGSFKSEKHLTFTPKTQLVNNLLKGGEIHALMDLSDGLGKDLPRLCKASNVGYSLDLEKIPLNKGISLQNGLFDGEDYELLFTCSKEASEQYFSHCEQVTKIGTITPDIEQPLDGGWDHFKP